MGADSDDLDLEVEVAKIKRKHERVEKQIGGIVDAIDEVSNSVAGLKEELAETVLGMREWQRSLDQLVGAVSKLGSVVTVNAGTNIDTVSGDVAGGDMKK